MIPSFGMFQSPRGAGRPKVGSPPSAPKLSREINAVKISLSYAGTGDGGTMQSSDPGTSVLFEISVGGQPAGLLEARPMDIGLPLTLDQARAARHSESSFRLPDHVLASLDAVIPKEGAPLWLSFPAPSGYLAGVPWERLLKTRLSVPVMRLSYADVQPVTPRGTRDIAVCFSFARAKEAYLLTSPEAVVSYFFQNIPVNIAHYTTFHVFADAILQPFLGHQRSQSGAKIEIYDPRQAAQYAVIGPNTAQTEQLDNPWLLWMRDALGQRSVDVVHFLCQGFTGRQEGFLALSESPVSNMDPQSARFVGVRQLCSFLNQVGAWSTAFTSPAGNVSIFGQRLLQDEIARNRPGPVLLHDMERDVGRQGLDEAYQFAYAIEEAFPPQSPAVSLSCHPEWAMPWAQRDPASQKLLSELTLMDKLEGVLESDENTPSWLASGQRSLERSVAQLMSSTGGDATKALNSGTADALRFTANLLERHAHLLKNLPKGVK